MENHEDKSPEVAPVRLGVTGLPDLSNLMIVGGVYALEARMPSARYPILESSLQAALDAGQSCAVIVPSKPEGFVERVAQSGMLDIQQLIQDRRLQMFVMQSEFQKKIFRYGPASFLKEMERFEIRENSFLVFDQADDLLALHDVGLAIEQIDVLVKWFHQRRITCLLVFTRVTDDNAWALDALMDSMTGIASLGGHGEGLQFNTKYWRSPEGTVAATAYRLGSTETGRYQVLARQEPTVRVEQVVLPQGLPLVSQPVALPVVAGAAPSVPSVVQGAATMPPQGVSVSVDPPPSQGAKMPERPVEVSKVFYTDSELDCLADSSPIPWVKMDSMVGILHATLHDSEATVILGYDVRTRLRDLAATVHALRMGLDLHAHIIVRENNASLRYNNEALLLHLGVSLVIHRDVTVSRIPLMIQSLQGRVYRRPINVEFDAALASVAPTELRGYLNVARFEKEVVQILDRAEMLDIPNVLVVGRPHGRDIVSFLRGVQPTRPGDLLTADHEFCYLFLNACPPAAVPLALDKILVGVKGRGLLEQRVIFQPKVIREEIRRSLTRSHDLPDYTHVLTQVPASNQAELHHAEALPELEPVMKQQALVDDGAENLVQSSTETSSLTVPHLLEATGAQGNVLGEAVLGELQESSVSDGVNGRVDEGVEAAWHTDAPVLSEWLESEGAVPPAVEYAETSDETVEADKPTEVTQTLPPPLEQAVSVDDTQNEVYIHPVHKLVSYRYGPVDTSPTFGRGSVPRARRAQTA